MKLITLIVLFSAVLLITASSDNESAEVDLDQEEDQNGESELIDKREALNFFKRTFFHPGKTKNEEIKRETREVYEEKCENIIPLASR